MSIPFKKKQSLSKKPIKIFLYLFISKKNIHTKKPQISNSYLIPLTNLAFLIWKKNWAFKNEKNINRFYLKNISQGYISIILYLKYLYYMYSYIL